MRTIIKIHGCSGAGKTTAVRELMKRYGSNAVMLGDKIEGYEVYTPSSDKTYVMGSYENTCGGMDTVGSAEVVMNLLEWYYPRGNVIFEGLLQSTYYGKMGAHSLQYGSNYIYAFLDTPIELCLERVVARRAASRRNNKFNPELTREKHATIDALRRKLVAGGQHRVVELKHDKSMAEQLMELLV